MAVAAFVAPFLMPATVRFVAAAAQLPDVRLAVINMIVPRSGSLPSGRPSGQPRNDHEP
jgi:hypothetical protein